MGKNKGTFPRKIRFGLEFKRTNSNFGDWCDQTLNIELHFKCLITKLHDEAKIWSASSWNRKLVQIPANFSSIFHVAIENFIRLHWRLFHFMLHFSNVVCVTKSSKNVKIFFRCLLDFPNLLKFVLLGGTTEILQVYTFKVYLWSPSICSTALRMSATVIFCFVLGFTMWR